MNDTKEEHVLTSLKKGLASLKLDGIALSNLNEELILIKNGYKKIILKGYQTEDDAEISLTLENIKEHFFDAERIDNYANGDDICTWEDNIRNSDAYSYRIEFFRYFTKFSEQKHCEMILSIDEDYKMLNIRKIIETVISTENLKIIILKDPINWSRHEEVGNNLRTLQGYMLYVLTHCILRPDFKFTDTIDSLNIEYNDPFTRKRIRKQNQKIGEFWVKDFDVKRFCKDQLDKHFGSNNGIWLDYFHETQVNSLEFIRYCFEFGLCEFSDSIFSHNKISDFSQSLYKACFAIKTLERDWRQKWQFMNLRHSLDITKNYMDYPHELIKISEFAYKEYYELNNKLIFVAKNSYRCKQNISLILVQLITLEYDKGFIDIFPDLLCSLPANGLLDFKEINRRVSKVFLFANEEFNSQILYITLNYLNKKKKLGNHDVYHKDSSAATQKILMYVISSSRDCFITSLRQVTNNDLIFFTDANESTYIKTNNQKIKIDKFNSAIELIRESLIDIINDISQGCKICCVACEEEVHGLKKDIQFSKDTEEKINKISKIIFFESSKVKDSEMQQTEQMPFARSNTLHNSNIQDSEILKSIFNIDEEDSQKFENLIKLIYQIFEKIKEILEMDFQGHAKMIFSKYSIITILLSLADYLSDNSRSKHCGKIQAAIFDIIHLIAQDNNYGKAQIFKGQGWFHFLNLIQKNNTDSLLLCIKLTTERNLSAYVNKVVFKILIDHYTILVNKMIQEYEKEVDIKKQSKMFNPTIYCSILLMSQFFSRLFREKFISERQRIGNMLMLQQRLFEVVAEICIPYSIAIIENEDIKRSESEKVNNPVFFSDIDCLKDLILFINMQNLKEHSAIEGQTDLQIQKIKLTVYIAMIEVFNGVSCILYTRKVLQKINPCAIIKYQPKFNENHFGVNDSMEVCDEKQESLLPESGHVKKSPLQMVINHLENTNFSETHDYIPTNMNPEFLKIVRLFFVLPEANWLIDRICNFEVRLDVLGEKDVPNFIITMIKKSESFIEKDFKTAGESYILDGLMPIIYKYLTGILNLINYRNVDKIKNACEILEDIIYELKKYQFTIETLCSQEHVKDRFSEVKKIAKSLSKNLTQQHTNKSKSDFSQELKRLCFYILQQIKQLYNGYGTYESNLSYDSPVSRLQYKNDKDTLKFDKSKLVCPELAIKQRLLNGIIAEYRQSKKRYVEGDGDVNLMQAFLQNPDKMKEFLLGFSLMISKYAIDERHFFTGLGDNALINIFWLKPNIRVSIQCLNRLFIKDRSSRQIFTKFINQDIFDFVNVEDYEQTKKINNEMTPVYVDGMRSKKVLNNIENNKKLGNDEIIWVDENRRQIFDFLLKVSTDILFFLLSKPTIDRVWWNLADEYDLILSFIKNVAEGNNMAFKVWFSCYIPSSRFDIHWNTIVNKIIGKGGDQRHMDSFNATELILCQMLYTVNFSLICENQFERLIHTDQFERIYALLKPQIILLNELVIGPCKENLEIILSVPYLPLYSIITRVMEDLTSDFINLQYLVLTFMNNLLITKDRSIITRVAKRLSVQDIEKLIISYTKKMYIREKIKEGTVRKIFLEGIRKTYSTMREIPQKGLAKSQEDYEKCELQEIIKNCNIVYMYPSIIYRTLQSAGVIDNLSEALNKNKIEYTVENLKKKKEDIIEKLINKRGVDREKLKTALECDLHCAMEMYKNLQMKQPIITEKQTISDISNLLDIIQITREITEAQSNLKMLGYNIEDFDQNIISEKLEGCSLFEIKDWDNLYHYYLHSKEFSEGLRFNEYAHVYSQDIFSLNFSLFTLWHTLALYSWHHRDRLRQLQVQEDAKKHDPTSTKTSTLADDTIGINFEKISIMWFWHKVSVNIELVFENENLLLRFPLKPSFFIFCRKTQANFLKNCNEFDSNSKMIKLMNEFNYFKHVMDDSIEKFRTNKILFHLKEKKTYSRWKRVLYSITVICNLFFLQGLRKDYVGRKLGIISPYYYFVQIQNLISIILSVSGIMAFYTFRYNTTKIEQESHFYTDNPCISEMNLLTRLKINIWDSFLNQTFVFSMVFHTICIFLYHVCNYAFQPLNLLMIVNISTTTRNIILATIQHAKQLFMTFLFGIFIILFFSVIIMQYFSDEFNEGFGIIVDCDTLFDSFMYTISQGQTQGGGIGDVMSIVDPHKSNFFGKFFLQISFFLIINIIFLNVIFGIIIDTFSYLREENIALAKDRKNVCFVCGLSRFDFSKKNIDFKLHGLYEHNQWHYIGYLYYLSVVGINNLDGVGTFVWESFLKKRTDWIPIGKTLYLKAEEDSMDYENLDKKLGRIESWLTKYEEHIIKEKGQESFFGKIDIEKNQENSKKFTPNSKISTDLVYGISKDLDRYNNEVNEYMATPTMYSHKIGYTQAKNLVDEINSPNLNSNISINASKETFIHPQKRLPTRIPSLND